MSSYLHIYLVPKTEDAEVEAKPLYLTSFCRGTDIYERVYEELHPVYGGDEQPKYTELTADSALRLLRSAQDFLAITESHFQSRVRAYKAVAGDKIPEDVIEDFVSTEEQIKDLKDEISVYQFIHDIVSDLHYSDFDKVLMNIA